MQRSGAATRRFYAAFYHWTLRSGNPTRRCAGTTSTLVARRKQSTTHGVGGSSRLQNHGETIGTSEQLRKETVQSTADRPTESLDLWEHAIRDKSEKSVKVELLVPGRALRSKDVANRARIHEVKLSSPGLREDAGDEEPCAVILEGDYTDVKAVWKTLYSHGAEQSSNGSTATKQTTHADVEPIAHRLRQDFARQQQHSFVEKECSLPESFWQPIGREGTVEYLQTQFGLHVDMLDEIVPLQYARLKGSERQVRELDEFLEDIRAWELEKTRRKNKTGNAPEKQVKIIRRNDLPSENLEVWQSVTRKQLQGETEIDICLPERVWQRIRSNGGVENLNARFAMQFEPLEVSRDGKTRCIAFKGDIAYAERAKSYFEGFRVNIPELQDDEEYLKIYSAATGLHTIIDGDQRQSAHRSQVRIESNKNTTPAVSGKSHRSSITFSFSPEKQPTRDDAVLDQSGDSYKNLALTSPEEQSLRDDGNILDRGRFAVPEHIRQELEASKENTLAQIQQESGIEAILCLETAESKQFLKIIGTKDAREQARALLQKSIDSDNERTGRSNPDVDELARSIELDFSFPIPTHIAWVQMPEGTGFPKSRKFHVQYQTYTSVRLRESASGKRLVRIRGSSASVNLVIARVQRLIDEDRNAKGKPSAKLEVLKMGLIEGVGEGCPVELSEKSVEDEQQTSPETTAKDTATEEQPPTSSDKNLDTPKAANVRTHFAWLKVPKTHSRSKYDARAKVIAEKHGCSINAHKHVTEKEGIVSIHGSEEALSNAIRDLQHLSDEGCKDNGILPVKLEVVSKGLYGDMPTTAAVRQLIHSSVKELEKPEECVWLRIAKAIDRPRSVPMKTAIAVKNGCFIGRYRRLTEEEGVVKIYGSREAVSNTINDLQQLCDEGRKKEGKPSLKVEIVYTGSLDEMPEHTAVKQSILTGAHAIGKDQGSETSANKPASLPQHTSIGNGAVEQAETVSSSSASGETSQHATVDKTSVPKASRAEEQATKQSNQQLSDDMRSALRYITQPVALVTSYTPQGRQRQGERKRAEARGVTVSSFCTVTLQPTPVVSFNLRVPSRSWDAISGSGYLRAHLLKASPEGAAVAHAFTLPYEQPHQPFEQLSQSGMEVTYFRRTRDRAKVPRITSRSAVHANFVAKVMPEKCIQVGDHMIVVAEVTETELSSFADASLTGALSYGMRGYRQLGGEIKPMEIKPAEQTRSETQPAKVAESVENAPEKVVKITEQDDIADHAKPVEKALKKVESTVSVVNEITEPAEQESVVDHVQPDENTPEKIATNDTADLYERFAADPDDEDFEATLAPSPRNIEDLGPSSPMLDEGSLRQVLEENEAAYSSLGLPSQTAADNPALAEALNAVAGAYNDASEPAVPSQPESTSETQDPLEDQPADPAATSQPEPNPQTEAHAKSATLEDRPANALSTGKRPWGMDNTMTQQIRKMSIYHTSPPRRHYSTDSADSDSANQPPLSKQILKTTVADYLAQIPTHRKRYTNLIKLHRSASSLEAQLQAPQATLTPEEHTALSTQAQTTRRKVSRELALRNAQDLRAMLDNGRVASASAAQWLESNLEHGQVVLLEEAKVLRRELEDGRLSVVKFEKAKGDLTRDYEVIDAQLMRLRDFAEDDVEDMDDGEFGTGGGVGEDNQDGREKGSG